MEIATVILFGLAFLFVYDVLRRMFKGLWQKYQYWKWQRKNKRRYGI